jgi:hypothetical protein
MANISGRVLTHDFTSKFPDCRVQMIRHTLRTHTHTHNMCIRTNTVCALSLETSRKGRGCLPENKVGS